MNPFLHLDSFRSTTTSKRYNNEVMCLMFQEILTGEAMSCSSNSNHFSSTVSKPLTDAFASWFILMTDGYHTTRQLFKFNQEEAESLKSFVNHWRTTTSQCGDLDKSLTYMAFKQGLKPDNFLYKLNTHSHKNMMLSWTMLSSMLKKNSLTVTCHHTLSLESPPIPCLPCWKKGKTGSWLERKKCFYNWSIRCRQDVKSKFKTSRGVVIL